MELYHPLIDNLAHNKSIFWIGVVEDNADPMTLGRVKVRIFSIHPEDKSLVPTKDLPWAMAMQPANSASTSGAGWSPNGLLPSSWVFGIFLDELGQYPLVLGSLPTIHRGAAPGEDGGAGSGYLDSNTQGEGAVAAPFHGQGQENPATYPGTSLPNSTAGGNAIRDTGERLTKNNITNWPLKIYTWRPSNGNNGLACKDSQQSLNMHKASCLALEELTKQWGRGALKLNSAYRSPSYNAGVGGARRSMHVEGRAFDIQLASIGGQNEIIKFIQLAVKNGFTGFGLYSSFIHIDTGAGRTWLGASSGWFINALKQAGWYPGKAGLQGIKVDSNNPNPPNGTPGTGIGSDAVADKTTTGQSSGGIGSDAVASNSASQTPIINNNTSAIQGRATAYGPGSGGTEGGIKSAIAGPDGRNLCRTLEDVRNGRSAYVTLAGNRKFFGRTYTIPSITYDYQGQRHTLVNIKGVVHDTGGDFTNAPEGRFDIAVAQYMGSGELDRQPFSGQTLTYIPGYSGTSSSSSNPMPGFSDPSNSLPYSNYRGQPSTNMSARGWNGYPQQSRTRDDTGAHSGYPAAGSKGSFGEPASPFAPQYPHNYVYSTKSGHIMEFDDTPNAERVNIQHKSGTKWEISSKGTSVVKIQGNSYHFTTGNSYMASSGNMLVTSVGDMGIRSTSDLTIHSDGSKTELVFGDNSTHVSGNFDILVGGVVQAKASKIILETNDLNIFAKGNINCEATGNINLKAGGNFTASSGGNSSLKGGTVYLDDVVRMSEGGAKDAPSASSTDLGKVRAKKVINRQPSPSVNFDTYTTADDAAEHYSK